MKLSEPASRVDWRYFGDGFLQFLEARLDVFGLAPGVQDKQCRAEPHQDVGRDHEGAGVTRGVGIAAFHGNELCGPIGGIFSSLGERSHMGM